MQPRTQWENHSAYKSNKQISNTCLQSRIRLTFGGCYFQYKTVKDSTRTMHTETGTAQSSRQNPRWLTRPSGTSRLQSTWRCPVRTGEPGVADTRQRTSEGLLLASLRGMRVSGHHESPRRTWMVPKQTQYSRPMTREASCQCQSASPAEGIHTSKSASWLVESKYFAR